jgi:hypothetical protein
VGRPGSLCGIPTLVWAQPPQPTPGPATSGPASALGSRELVARTSCTEAARARICDHGSVLKTGSRWRRVVNLACIVVASVTGLLSVTWGGGAVSAWAGQTGKSRATARVVQVDGNRSSGELVVEFVTRDGRTVAVKDHRRGWPQNAGQGSRVEVAYDPQDPAGSVQRFQDLGGALGWWALFTATAVLSGVASYRTRARGHS